MIKDNFNNNKDKLLIKFWQTKIYCSNPSPSQPKFHITPTQTNPNQPKPNQIEHINRHANFRKDTHRQNHHT